MLINKLIYWTFVPSIRFRNISFLATTKTEKGKQSDNAHSKAQSKEGKTKPSGTKDKAGDKGFKEQEVMLGNVAPKKRQPVPESILAYFKVPTKANIFYRKILQKAQIKQKMGRSTFSEQGLIHIVELAIAKDINLLFQSYFNYLGHFTFISNKTVDAILVKASKLGSENEQLKEDTCKKVLQVLQHHEYLGYFPHFLTTLNILEFAEKTNKFTSILQILRNKILIKIDNMLINRLYQLATNWNDFIKLTKILSFRFNSGLLVDVTKENILHHIATGIMKIDNIRYIQPGKQYQSFLQAFEQPSTELALAWVIIFNQASKTVEILKQIQSNDPNINTFPSIIEKLQLNEPKVPLKQNIQTMLKDTAHEKLLG